MVVCIFETQQRVVTAGLGIATDFLDRFDSDQEDPDLIHLYSV